MYTFKKSSKSKTDSTQIYLCCWPLCVMLSCRNERPGSGRKWRERNTGEGETEFTWGWVYSSCQTLPLHWTQNRWLCVNYKALRYMAKDSGYGVKMDAVNALTSQICDLWWKGTVLCCDHAQSRLMWIFKCKKSLSKFCNGSKCLNMFLHVLKSHGWLL